MYRLPKPMTMEEVNEAHRRAGLPEPVWFPTPRPLEDVLRAHTDPAAELRSLVGQLQALTERTGPVAQATPPPRSRPKYLTRAELAERWSCSLSTVDRRLRKHADLLPVPKAIGGVRVRVSDVERFEASAAPRFAPARTPKRR